MFIDSGCLLTAFVAGFFIVRNLQFGGTVMKVFISWSGELSHKVARIFRDWLPNVVQILEPYVSSEDIDKGNGVTS